jgi:hypothetical protein
LFDFENAQKNFLKLMVGKPCYYCGSKNIITTVCSMTPVTNEISIDVRMSFYNICENCKKKLESVNNQENIENKYFNYENSNFFNQN